MREVKVHAESGEEALAEGTAALGVDPRNARVEILSEDEDGVTARVWVPDDVDSVEAVEEQAINPPDAAAYDAEEDEQPGNRLEPEDEGEDDDDAADQQPDLLDDFDEEELPEDPTEQARHHLSRVLTLMGVDAQVEVLAENDDEVTLNIVGGDVGAVIGSYGQTLNAVQFLLNLMINRRGRRRRVVVDAEGYRDRRRQRLEQIAEEQAKRAKNERRDVILEGLRAGERRIIHMHLQNDPDVVTTSEGEEPHRRLIISPRS